MYEYADATKKPEADALAEAGRELHFVAGVGHDRYAAKGADDGSRIDGSQRDQKTRVDRKQKHEVQSTSADVFGEGDEIVEKERLKELLYELAGARQQNYLPFGPVGDSVSVRVNDGHKSELESEPDHLHENPEQEVCFELHVPHDGVLAQRSVDGEMASDGGRGFSEDGEVALWWGFHGAF